MWEHIFNGPTFFTIPQRAFPKAVIMPHHDIAIHNLNGFYTALSVPIDSLEKFNPSVIVLISPDHFEKGKKLITLPENVQFASPEGNLVIDKELINKIANQKELKNILSFNDSAFVTEHGIYAHTPFIKHYFPNAKVVPILTKMFSSDTEFLEIQKLGEYLSKVLPKNSLVIASVDFSHYQTPKMTDIHDNVAKNIIFNMEDPRFAEVDSPETLGIIFEYCKKQNATFPFLIHKSSTFDFIPKEDVVSTSHQYWAFYDEQVNNHLSFYYNIRKLKKMPNYEEECRGRNQTILIAGSGTTQAGIRTKWKWDRYKTATDKAEILLRDLAGTEARFLHGFDALIFDPEVGTKYQRKMHDTALFVDVITQAEFTKKYKSISKDKIQANKEIQKQVKVLEVIYDSVLIDEQLIKLSLNDYDVVVFRDNEAKKDAFAYLFEGQTLQKINLGIIAGKKSLKGKLLVIEFFPDTNKITTFDYKSNNGIPPKINQFFVE